MAELYSGEWLIQYKNNLIGPWMNCKRFPTFSDANESMDELEAELKRKMADEKLQRIKHVARKSRWEWKV